MMLDRSLLTWYISYIITMEIMWYYVFSFFNREINARLTILCLANLKGFFNECIIIMINNCKAKILPMNLIKELDMLHNKLIHFHNKYYHNYYYQIIILSHTYAYFIACFTINNIYFKFSQEMGKTKVSFVTKNCD